MKKLLLAFALATGTGPLLAQDSTYKAVTAQLLLIDELDQQYRNRIEEVENKYGRNSAEIRTLYKNMKQADSLNLLQVEAIIEKHGWLGPAEIGSQANTTLFMVIQHSNLTAWKKYAPLMRAAVKNGKAKASQLALLEDRLALNEGRKQIYGSQVFWSATHNRYFVAPLEDPDHVDTKRAEVGLEPLAAYLSAMDMKWDAEQYKKDLPLITAEMKLLKH